MLCDLPEVMSPNQYAEITGENAQSVRYRCQTGVLPAVKDGRRWLIPRDLIFGKLIELEKEAMKKGEACKP